MTSDIRKKLLLVEDETIIAMAEKLALEKYGYDVILVTSGEKAVEAVREFSGIDLVLMDIDLGAGIDGTESAERILKERDLPVVFLSSHTDPEMVERTEKITSYGYVVKSSSITVLDASIKMAFKLYDAKKRLSDELAERKRVESSLVRAELTWEKTFNSMSDIVAMVSCDHEFLAINEAGIRSLGLPKEAILGRKCYELVHGTNCPIEQCPCDTALKSGMEEFSEYTVDGHHFILQASPMRDEKGDIVAFVHVVGDVTERKRAEMELHQAMEQYQSLAEGTQAILWEYNIAMDRWTYVAPQAERILGYAPKEWIDLKFWADHIHDDDRGWATDYCAACTARGEAHIFEYRFLAKDGRAVWLRDVVSVEMEAETPAVLRGFMIDITERKNDEDRIKTLLAEKELILREVHHRVKNNMSIIGSLLSLQANALSDPTASAALADTENRVKCMRLLYDKLYLPANYRRMSLRDYLSDLTEEVLSNFPNRQMVVVEKDIDDFSLEVEKLQPLGIIVNELLTNTMKYAFTGRKSGRINVSAKRRDGTVSVTVGDDGVAFTRKPEAGSSSGFGLELVTIISRQLGGSFRMENHNGTRSIVEFAI